MKVGLNVRLSWSIYFNNHLLEEIRTKCGVSVLCFHVFRIFVNMLFDFRLATRHRQVETKVSTLFFIILSLNVIVCYWRVVESESRLRAKIAIGSSLELAFALANAAINV